MAAFDWPVSLVIKRGTLQKVGRPVYAREDSTVGSPKRRKIFAGTMETYSFTIEVTDTSSEIFWDFYNNVLLYGGEAFNWTHPITSVVYEMIFQEEPSQIDISYNWNAISVKIGES